MLKVPRVAIIGGTLPKVIIKPLNVPNTAPNAIPRTTANTTGISGYCFTTNATIIATRPIMELTERSIP
jgi:hypothetical protein